MYFLEVKLNNNPCLILDQRIIDVFANNVYDDFSEINHINYYNAEANYTKYLYLVHELSSKIKTEGENVEQFLFMFGNNLKPIST